MATHAPVSLEELIELVRTLHESRRATLREVLEGLNALPPALPRSLAEAPEDDEPDDDDFDGGLTEARADVGAGRVYSWDEVQKELDS